LEQPSGGDADVDLSANTYRLTGAYILV